MKHGTWIVEEAGEDEDVWVALPHGCTGEAQRRVEIPCWRQSMFADQSGDYVTHEDLPSCQFPVVHRVSTHEDAVLRAERVVVLVGMKVVRVVPEIIGVLEKLL